MWDYITYIQNISHKWLRGSADKENQNKLFNILSEKISNILASK